MLYFVIFVNKYINDDFNEVKKNLLVYNFVMRAILLIVTIFFLMFQAPGYCSQDNAEISEAAKAFYNSGNIDDSMILFAKIPENARTEDDWLLLGNLCLDINKPLDAAFMYNKAIGVNPKSWKAYYNLGNIYLSDNQPNKAIAYYKAAAKYNREFSYIYYNIACAYIKLEAYSKAKSQLNKAISLKNDVANYYYQLAFCYKKLNNTKKAQQYLDLYKEVSQKINN